MQLERRYLGCHMSRSMNGSNLHCSQAQRSQHHTHAYSVGMSLSPYSFVHHMTSIPKPGDGDRLHRYTSRRIPLQAEYIPR
jgi:hypothetical protein